MLPRQATGTHRATCFLRARPVPSSGSGDVLAIPRANGFLITDETTGEKPEGTELPVIPLNEFQLR